MKAKLLLGATLAAAGFYADCAAANGQRIYYKGSDAVAAQAAGLAPGPASYPPVPLPLSGAPSTVLVPAAPTQNCLNCGPGANAAKNFGAGTPNAIVTFLHPYTNKAVSIPMTLPVGKPHLIIRSDRIIYDYGSIGCVGRYVVVRFFPDGTVMVKYH